MTRGHICGYVEPTKDGYLITFTFHDSHDSPAVKRLQYIEKDGQTADLVKESILEYVATIPTERQVGISNGLTLAAHIAYFMEKRNYIPIN